MARDLWIGLSRGSSNCSCLASADDCEACRASWKWADGDDDGDDDGGDGDDDGGDGDDDNDVGGGDDDNNGGTAMQWWHWKPGEPTTDDCGRLTHEAQWRDRKCDLPLRFICEQGRLTKDRDISMA